MRDYRLPRQVAGTRVALSRSPLGPNHRGVRMGTIVGTRGVLVFVDWDDEDEGKMYDSAELRYMLDRDLLRLTPPPKPRRTRVPKEELVCKTCGHKGRKRCGCPRPGAPKPEQWGMRQIGSTSSFPKTLTGIEVADRMTPSSMPTDQKGEPAMPEEVDQEETETESTGTLSPKDLAARAGTDAKTFRRFLRSDQSGYENAGQGNRYSFTEAEAEALVERYKGYASGRTERKPRDPDAPRKSRKGKKGGDVEPIDFQSAKRRDAAEATVEDDLEEIDLDDLDLDVDSDPVPDMADAAGENADDDLEEI